MHEIWVSNSIFFFALALHGMHTLSMKDAVEDGAVTIQLVMTAGPTGAISAFVQLRQKPLNLPTLPVIYASQELLGSQPLVQGVSLMHQNLAVTSNKSISDLQSVSVVAAAYLVISTAFVD